MFTFKKKYIALRLIALLMFPYSASAAAACHTNLDYGLDNGPDFAYEAAAYQTGQIIKTNMCGDAQKAEEFGNAHLPSLSGINDLSL